MGERLVSTRETLVDAALVVGGMMLAGGSLVLSSSETPGEVRISNARLSACDAALGGRTLVSEIPEECTALQGDFTQYGGSYIAPTDLLDRRVSPEEAGVDWVEIDMAAVLGGFVIVLIRSGVLGQVAADVRQQFSVSWR